MDDIRLWAIGLCTAAVICSVLKMLVPKGHMERIFSLLLGAFFLCCMVLPLLSIGSLGKLRLSLPQRDDADTALSAQVQTQLEQQLNQSLTATVRRLLEGTEVDRVEIKRDNSRTDSIYIDSVTVFLNPRSAPLTLEQQLLLKEQLGVEVGVTYAD